MKIATKIKGYTLMLTLSLIGMSNMGMSARSVEGLPQVRNAVSANSLKSQGVSPINVTIGEEPVLTDIIMEVEGRVQEYDRYAEGYFSYMGVVYKYTMETEPSPSQIVYGENNEVYFKDIMDFGWSSYIKGTLEGSKITVKLPQTLYVETYSWAEEPYYQNLCVLTQNGTGENLDFDYNPDITEVTYTIGENGNVTLDPLPDGNAIGIFSYYIGKVYDTDDDEITEDTPYELKWIGYWESAADFKQEFEALDIEEIVMPKGVEPLTYYVVTNGYNYPVNIAIQDNKMYIQGFGDSPYLSDMVMVATIDGDKATIAQNEYVGIISYDNERVITKCGYRKNYDVIFEPDNVGFELNIDEERHLLTPVDKNMYLCYAYNRLIDEDLNQNGLLTYFSNFYILYQDSFSGTPSDPYGLFANDDFYAGYGYHTFGFEISAFSTDGEILLTGNLYYSIFIDDELVLFEYDPDGQPYSHYYTLPEPTTEIPYMFTNDNDLDIWSETERQVGYYIDGVTTIGVQAVYYYDDVRTVSDIMTLNLETGEVTKTPAAGVGSISDDAYVVSTEYYDLNGRKISHPGKGIYIAKQLLSNGKVRNVKTYKAQ